MFWEDAFLPYRPQQQSPECLHLRSILLIACCACASQAGFRSTILGRSRTTTSPAASIVLFHGGAASPEPETEGAALKVDATILDRGTHRTPAPRAVESWRVPGRAARALGREQLHEAHRAFGHQTQPGVHLGHVT